MSVLTTVGFDHLPPVLRAVTSLDRVDYADAFTATVPSATEWSPEEWARAALEESDLGGRARLLWRSLGLELGPPDSPDHVQGWRIDARGEDWIRCRTRSWYASLNAVFHVAEGEVTLALFIRFDRPLVGRPVWAVVGPLHRRGGPALLVQARRLLMGRRGTRGALRAGAEEGRSRAEVRSPRRGRRPRSSPAAEPTTAARRARLGRS